ncbi:MAG TPA: hypothetical protein VFE37_16360 [Chloroflexota bacterium]|nr:hypothetical protein [Chloroflexota bacterium]
MILFLQRRSDSGGQHVKERVEIVANDSGLRQRLRALRHGHHLE